MDKKRRESLKTDLDEIKAKLESLDSKVESILKTLTPTTQNTYEDLPWKSFKSGKGSWIFADSKGAEELLHRLKEAKGNTIFTEAYRFVLSKEDGKFIQRYPRNASNLRVEN